MSETEDRVDTPPAGQAEDQASAGGVPPVDEAAESVAAAPAAEAGVAESLSGEAADSGEPAVSDLEEEGEYAADYLEGLLDILDLDGDLDLDVEGSRAAVAIVGNGLESLVGEGGQTLEALQDLTRLAVQQRSGARSRLMLDVAGHRARRRVELSELGTAAARRAAETAKAERLAPMTPFERKIVHDAVAAVAGVHSESEGEEPSRRVVVLPD